MSKPVLSLDVSKGVSTASAYIDYEKPLSKPFSVPHTMKGSIILLNHLRKLEDLTGSKPEVILEATGHYSKPITNFLMEAGYSVIALNPLQTHDLKRRTIRKVKTDAVDTQRIAELYYLQRFTPLYSVNPQIAELKTLCRQYDGFQALYTETQLRFQSIIDLIFPTYTKVFSKLYRDSALKLIDAYPTPESVLAADKCDILKYLDLNNQPYDWAYKIYSKLVAAAQECLPYKVAQQSNIRVLREYVQLLMTQKKLVADVWAQIVATAKDISTFHLLCTIPGVGELTAAIILTEIEDVHRFPTAPQLVAFAGLDPSVFESGKFKASKNRISKRGSTYLRKALFQAAAIGIRKRNDTGTNPVLYNFYHGKVAEGKPKMVALIATCNKLLRIIYGMWRKNETFRVE